MSRYSIGLILAVVVTAAPAAALRADPPPWAPAWGWRAKHAEEPPPVVVVPAQPIYVVPQPAYVVPPPQPAYVLPWAAGTAPASYGIAQGTCYRQALGALIGAGAGAYAGNNLARHHQLVNTIAGGVLGALVGGLIGEQMDELDQSCVGQVLERAATGRAVAWRNPHNGERYSVSPLRTYQAEDGRYCREYRAQARIAGRPQQTYGTACRQPDGSWQITND